MTGAAHVPQAVGRIVYRVSVLYVTEEIAAASLVATARDKDILPRLVLSTLIWHTALPDPHSDRGSIVLPLVDGNGVMCQKVAAGRWASSQRHGRRASLPNYAEDSIAKRTRRSEPAPRTSLLLASREFPSAGGAQHASTIP